eukprot:jgi/Tetstr1/428370/TSEL_018405.t1
MQTWSCRTLGEAAIDEFETYEDYLDRQITSTDFYRGNGEIIKREEFEARKEAAEAAIRARLDKKPKKLSSAGRNLDGYPLLQALAQREEAVRNGKLTTIVFIRDRNKKGQEVSGYIDYGQRLKSGGMDSVFEPEEALDAQANGLEFLQLGTQNSTSNAHKQLSRVVADNAAGLFVQATSGDRKMINVDPRSKPGDNSRPEPKWKQMNTCRSSSMTM